ncbi:MAG: hypothetical protein L3J10_08975 [Sulfurimonas sp.]|nr:hypothetical protein [Sulfurimonas sp.]
MLPTKIAKAKVLSIQAFDKRVLNSKNRASREAIILKSFKTTIPKIIPPKREIITFRVYSAKTIARSDGSSENAEFSISNQSKFVS